MGPADSDRITRVPPYSGYLTEFIIFRLQDCHLLRFAFPHNSTIIELCNSYIRILQPQINLVWAISCSLATTKEIDFSFFSSGYLDVSVPRVALTYLCIQHAIPTHYHRWVPSFGDPRIKAYLQLPEAYRSLSRPSSASSAKASAMRPY